MSSFEGRFLVKEEEKEVAKSREVSLSESVGETKSNGCEGKYGGQRKRVEKGVRQVL